MKVDVDNLYHIGRYRIMRNVFLIYLYDSENTCLDFSYSSGIEFDIGSNNFISYEGGKWIVSNLRIETPMNNHLVLYCYSYSDTLYRNKYLKTETKDCVYES